MMRAGESEPTIDRRGRSFWLLPEKCFLKGTEEFGPFPERCFRPVGSVLAADSFGRCKPPRTLVGDAIPDEGGPGSGEPVSGAADDLGAYWTANVGHGRAFCDLADFFDAEGHVLPIHGMPVQARTALGVSQAPPKRAPRIR
jgi:hypothetical protein